MSTSIVAWPHRAVTGLGTEGIDKEKHQGDRPESASPMYTKEIQVDE